MITNTTKTSDDLKATITDDDIAKILHNKEIRRLLGEIGNQHLIISPNGLIQLLFNMLSSMELIHELAGFCKDNPSKCHEDPKFGELPQHLHKTVFGVYGIYTMLDTITIAAEHDTPNVMLATMEDPGAITQGNTLH